MNNIGIQMYTLRNETATDMIGTLRAVARIGYHGVEFAGYGGLEASELQAVLAELNLKSIGSHVGYQRLLDALDEEITYNLTIGSTFIICPYMSEEHRVSAEAWQAVYANFERIGLRCAEKGITFCYHNHGFEFSQKLDDKTAFDTLFDGVNTNALKVELDTCWVFDAGYDPITYIQKYAGRIPLIHLKDLQKTDSNKGLTVELGQGQLDLQGVVAAGKKAGTEWFIVEQDICQNPPLTSVQNSINWIKNNLRELGGVMNG